MTRLPQLALPAATFEGCPIGLSLIGSPRSEMQLIALAEAVRERESGRAAPANGWYPQANPVDSPTRGAPTAGPGGGVLAPPGPPGKTNGRRRGHLRVLPDPSD